ncbi:UvrD-helicase domain-containing protein [Maribacter sp. HTCC2170]|uniref:UvrD-helicase domain-containing protein n=1 Tax=Maribacter sp. (strain HTCC2170 / KCCM 42371) TaxID=313603 RepID=UPI00006BD313|nr:UvrD-helicase domain-containing protein [Maribacter sp. HTCC2170]EAR02013.1 helicase IV [Maribacter sp. HTCC2170]
MLVYVALGGIALTTISVSAYLNVKKKKRFEEEQRLRILESYKKSLQKILLKIEYFNEDFKRFRNEIKYISNYDIFDFKLNYEDLFYEVSNVEYKHLPDFENEINFISSFLLDYSKIKELIKERNNKFVKNELEKANDLLSDVEGHSLDKQQRNAIIVNEDNNLIIAGAGSGKTTTIAGKVKYLTQRLKVKPESILLISFTRKSADEMAERIQKKMDISLPVKTFHKLGLDILAESSNQKPSIFGLSQKEILQLITSFISNAKANSQYLNKLIDFLAYHLKPYKDIHDFESDAEHNNYLKEQKLEGYKTINKTTSNGVEIKYRERFKSQEEVLIANFFFRNNIEYRYEESYQYKTASKKFGQYKPDFYLPERKIYLEHFGIDEKGKVPSWFKGDTEKSAQQKYTEGIEWKRNEHRDNGTTLIETYSWEQKKGILLSNLKIKLEDKGVVFNPMSDDELWQYIEQYTTEDIDVFTQLLNTFLILFKSNDETINNLSNRANKEGNERAILFLELYEPIFKSYESYLKELNEIDFSDMINLATNSILNNQFTSPYKYIIIDEFQDISQARYKLIKSLLDQKPDTKLFCVGDDWQSIYRFAGSDIGVFTGFSKYFKSSSIKGFKRTTSRSNIEYTYRFENKLIDLSSSFILKNPNQIKKTLKSHKKSNYSPVTIHKYRDAERNGKSAYQALNNALEIINEKEKSNNISVLLLGRYDFERRIVEDSQNIAKKYNEQLNRYDYVFKGNQNHTINFLTIHASKGLEADYVVILNGNSGTYGFPSEISDDPLLNFLLSKADQFPNGEERRSFYVALTRAKKQVHILSSHEYPSKFIEEIEPFPPITSLKCEWCDNGKLVERNGRFGYFYACNNSHYCNYTRKIEAIDLKNVALEFSEKKDFESAIKYYLKSLEIGNDNGNTHFELGRSYEQNGQLEDALEHYNTSIYLDNNFAYVYFWRGSVLFDLRNYNDAINDWVKFKNLKPANNNVNYWLAKSYYNLKNYRVAISYLDKSLAVNKDDSDCIDLKNKCLEKK